MKSAASRILLYEYLDASSTNFSMDFAIEVATRFASVSTMTGKQLVLRSKLKFKISTIPTGRVDVFSVHFRNNLEYFVIKWRHFFRTFSKEIDSFHKKEETLFRSIVGVNFTVLIGNDLKLNHEEKKMFYRYFFGENWNYFMRKWRHFLRA